MPKEIATKSQNTGLKNAGKAKKDEFYTQLVDIEKEVKHYKNYFRGKVVYCNCDDPFESNFFKYFAANFNALGLKKLITTSYVKSPIVGKQIPLFEMEGLKPDGKEPYVVEINEVPDINNDGAISLEDVEALLRRNKKSSRKLQGNGDFRSEECIELLKEADIVVTNPPFSLFREYVAQLDELRQKLKDSTRTCTVDADCGNPEPVCYSGTEVGRSYCDGGVCAFKKTDCVNPEICAGKPATCIAPATGVKQQDGVSISRTIPEVGSCSQNLQDLNLQQSTPDSVRYAITGNIPNWLHIDKPGGALPAKVRATYSCNTVQGFGPGTYPANGSITVYNAANELINTIPFNVSITVTPVAQTIEAIEYNGKYLPTNQLIIENEAGCGADHWHAASGAVTATDGTQVSDPGPQCGFGKVADRPRIQVSAPKVSVPKSGAKGEVRGLEFLKAR